ncbi:retinol dehydrogenase 16 isoform X2 [Carlito syrichta]|uniref:Retinol dehydrogenase 16 isoform X2 n=1 Tax=Carlito syrichta TaxID=1868482 RepID=A0A3Q0DSL5_CARSF|nr:retinol dehydrogenase 16 isoform X2 [Carlito syrichta]
MSDREGSRGAEGPDIRQAGDSDPERHQDRERRCSRPVGEGTRGRQRRELSYFGVKVSMIEPGHFKTAVNSKERFLKSFQELWDRAKPEVKQVYGEKFLESYMKKTENLEQKCTEDLSLVTNCMEHALTAHHPRTRYSAGWDAKLLYLPMSYLPSLLVDAMVYWGSPRPAKAL